MVVYIEYAFLENALIDGLMLFLALKAVRLRVSGPRLALASSLGGGVSLIFPVLTLPVWCLTLVKFLGGALIAAVSCPKATLRSSLGLCAAFYLLTFALGGLLSAVSSFSGAEFVEGRGFFIGRAPVALVVGVALCFFCAMAALFRKLHARRAIEKSSCNCVIEGVRTVKTKGFLDSGNLLIFRGEPVSVLSPVAALALFAGERPVGRIFMRSAGGERSSPVFRARRLTAGGKRVDGALFAVGEVGIPDHPVLLNTSLLEGCDGNSHIAQDVA